MKPTTINRKPAGETASEILNLLEFAPLSQAELAEILGFSCPTVNYHVKRLLDEQRIRIFERVRLGKAPHPTTRYVAARHQTAVQENPFLTAAGLVAAPSGHGRDNQQH
ncbi:winged helix-turn-helix domain-containing protein [Burkholderia glumae]|uniref:winged helix-turn-helix domain-containing protein n=1 Tax=Burkholderia glumae TaxID=337 RepID=UPI00214F6AB8|nr:winged helix-turn-helix domain-containing protein [Burkholderia glumae]